MLDIIIKGGKVVDGAGGEARTADLAIQDGRIVEIGKVRARAREVIDADGALVTPGFIDVHTHYDGQFLWDDKLDPSFSHGLTTVIGGNCGVGFAPATKAYRRELMELMEGVEEIPGIVMDEGLDWGWTTFCDYMDRLAERRYAMDIASQITHAPLRVFVMGDRAIKQEKATPEEIASMSDHVREAMNAGAVGFSTGRLVEHLSSRGAHVPGTFAGEEELLALARAMGEGGRGVFQLIPKGAVGSVMGRDQLGASGRVAEHKLFEALARKSGRPVTYSIAELESDPGDLCQMARETERANSEGMSIHPQTAARGIGGIYMLDAYHAFLMRPSYRAIAHLSLKQRAEAMREPARRRAILQEPDVEGEYANEPRVLPMLKRLSANLGKTFILASGVDFEPGPERRVDVLAAAAGKTPEQFIYDHYAEGEGDNYNVGLMLNYAHGNLNHIYTLFHRPHVVSGLGDGGAHVKTVCDSTLTTYQLAFWTRDRTRGPRLPLELMVKKLTSELASLYGLEDRGVIAVGKRADINVIDYARLGLTRPYVAHDLPSGAARLLQGSVGYLATLVAGEITRRNDIDTGARPGRLVRLGHPN
jgi:N-acyl-D-aspartate/D-glutamate deacylase